MEFFTKHRVIADVARDLHTSLGHEFDDAPIDMNVAIHNRVVERRPGRLIIGVQTEHFGIGGLSQGWVKSDTALLRDNIARCDVIIDFAERNIPFYAEMGIETDARFHFGPYVFPQAQPEPHSNTSDKAIFFGTLGNKINPDAINSSSRSERLETYQKVLDIEVVSGRFNERLKRLLSEYGLIANVHYINDVYTEVPRYLKAFLNGMVLLSEPLEAPFIAGRHYALIDAPLPSPAERQQILANIHADFAPYQLAPLLRQLQSQWQGTTSA